MHGILILEKDAAAWKGGRGTGCVCTIWKSVSTVETVVSQCLMQCHMQLPHKHPRKASVPDHPRPLLLMALSHGVPKVWLGCQLLLFSCLKPRSQNPSCFSSLLLQSLKRSRDIQRVENKEYFDRGEVNWLLALSVPFLWLLRNQISSLNRIPKSLGNLDEFHYLYHYLLSFSIYR